MISRSKNLKTRLDEGKTCADAKSNSDASDGSRLT